MFGLIGAIVIALIFVWLLPVPLMAIFTVPMAIAAVYQASGIHSVNTSAFPSTSPTDQPITPGLPFTQEALQREQRGPEQSPSCETSNRHTRF